MVDYKEMYIRLFKATAAAITFLEEVQRECEEMYLAGTDEEVKILPFKPDTEKSTDGP